MLEVLGLDQPTETLYFVLVDNLPLPIEELARRTGIEPDAVAAAMLRLEDGGLVSRLPGSPACYTALPPGHAVEVLLLARERDIHRVRALTELLTERHRDARRDRDSASLIQVINGRDGVARCGQQLFNRAEKEIRGIDAPPYAEARDGGRVNSAAMIASRGVRSRFIHARDSLNIPGAMERAEEDIAAGEEVRFVPEAPMKLIIADDQAALIPLMATPQVLDACILVHPSALLDALSSLFESLWAQAQPYMPGRIAPVGEEEFVNDEERRIISMLAMGMPDETIARQLGIGHRTVQRRVQALLTRLGAASRFQAGVLAASRGWWLPEPPSGEPRAGGRGPDR
ncbi:helix-turn-helix transcriptional regulator [Actinacidiphila paucisporea]|uniref:Sugar-specific transcriptional regulator TrmB n=1 Tax=Actinacidiphila paucisporea TaxID=310782 RepID=A0A1M7H5L9_9ACTN|nr:LuxR family transcriptional regulator [Actinacidiphila paucisporea]SHM23881.1 Sugar-specific transcriptional regulator TrmB [Actinacidiphila paucisporea]